MPISPTTAALLRACAEVMAQGQSAEINLFSARQDLGFSGDRDAIGLCLAEAVADASSGQLTAILVPATLVKSRVKGPGIYVAVCPSGTTGYNVPADAPVYRVGPYDDGFQLAERVDIGS